MAGMGALPAMLLLLLGASLETVGVTGLEEKVMDTCLGPQWAGKGLRPKEYWARQALLRPLFGIRDEHVSSGAHSGAKLQRGNQDDSVVNSVILAVSNWESHRLASWVAALLLREKVGYRAVMVEQTDPIHTCVTGCFESMQSAVAFFLSARLDI